jgi:hypothetical protein
MKTFLSFLVFQVFLVLSLSAQPVSDYSYKLDNGITVRTERCWNQVWVQQGYADLSAADKTPLAVDIRTLGDLISSSSFKLISGGKEVKVQGTAPGTYDLRLTFKLSGKPGTLSFVVGNVVIKPKTKTTVSVTLYDYQIMINETSAAMNSLAAYESIINRCKTNTLQDVYFGLPTFFKKGAHDKAITPDETTSNVKGKIKPDTYDILLSIGISGQTHKVWLDNFTLKPDTKYVITTNLNAGGITYAGSSDVKAMHLYPAGTAAKQTGTPGPQKNIETIVYDKAKVLNCCSPGTYDVLLSYGNKYEWKKGIAVSTGLKTEVR